MTRGAWQSADSQALRKVLTQEVQTGPNLDDQRAPPAHSEAEVQEAFLQEHWFREPGGHLI